MMKRLSLLFLMLVMGITIATVMIATPPQKAGAASTRTFAFTNNTQQMIWVGALGKAIPAHGGWAMAPGSTSTVTVADNWQGRFWGRTYCNFDSAGVGNCETGDCGGVLQCNGAGGVPPASLAEFNLGGAGGTDYYDVSFVDGFNVPITITPVGGAQPTPGNHYWCGVAGCGVDLNAHCPSALQQKDASGRIVACKSACEALNTDQYCCRGAYATPSTCDPTTWPVNYASYFKSNCPDAYSYAYDDPTSTFTDSNANYSITFGPPGGSSGPPPTPTSGGGVTPTPTPIGNGMTEGVTSTSSTQAQFWFHTSGWTAGYVILHYTIIGQVQQNVYMSYDSGSSRWLYTAGGFSSGSVATYSFTYQQNGLQYDTSSYSWTHP